jgi:hypothetical protein
MEAPIANPATMTPQQRRQGIAAILARGMLRRTPPRACFGPDSHRRLPVRVNNVVRKGTG